MSNHLSSKKSVAFVLEFIVVVLGVLVAFWLSSWREEQKTEQLERFYLEELVESLILDQQQLSDVIQEQGHRRSVLDTLFQMMPHAESDDKPVIDSLFTSIRRKPHLLSRNRGVQSHGRRRLAGSDIQQRTRHVAG